MEQIRQAIRKMIKVSDEELDGFLIGAVSKTFKRNEILSRPNVVPNEIFFINKGTLRIAITDNGGTEHTLHFAMENQFVADYSNFIIKKPSFYTLQAVDELQVEILPRSVIEWGYTNMKEGQKMGRLIAEYYFIYFVNRIMNMYIRTPKERYDTITDVFPDIHNRVPQHMIASYLGITPIHLSRLKKSSLKKR
jgi:hypothetical protein